MLHRYIIVFRVIANLASGKTLTRAVDALFQRLYDSLNHACRRVLLTKRSDHIRCVPTS